MGFLTAKRLRPGAQGCRALTATLGIDNDGFQPRRGCVSISSPAIYLCSVSLGVTPLGFGSAVHPFPGLPSKPGKPWALGRNRFAVRTLTQRTLTTMLLTVKALPVAFCRSAIDLLRSVCAFSSSPFAVVNAVCRSRTRNTVD